MKKANFFNADKAMADRVERFIKCKAEFITLKARMQAEIDGLRAKIARYEDPEVILVESAEQRAALVAALYTEIETVRAKYAELVADNATFEYTEGDKALYKAYTEGNLEDGVCQWVAAYAKKDGSYLDMRDTSNLAYIVDSLGGKRSVSAKKHVNSGGTVFVGARTKSDILKVFYGCLAEQMIAAGTLKAAKFPKDIVEKYAPKKAAK